MIRRVSGSECNDNLSESVGKAHKVGLRDNISHSLGMKFHQN